MSNRRLAMLISGSGSTMEQIALACREGRLTGIEPSLVISSDHKAIGVARAIGLKIPHLAIVPRKEFSSAEEFGKALVKHCFLANIDLIGQYGWLPLTPASLIQAYSGQIINQHPAPLDPGRPDFGGKYMFGLWAHIARLRYVRQADCDYWSEATTHFVTPEFDKGQVIKRIRVPIMENETPEAFQKRMLPFEWECQIQALQDFANGTVKELPRTEPLVPSDKLPILEESKTYVKQLYEQRT